ncbi:hypothetical protein [Scytonema sp. UIC 10036]|uniref:hypothetical protein n=1 Tax=Scytonema sp. UIC 10036 TaxID=2304196 RepID=UPI001A9B5429|nr:hypothetical protein [Scytonema sp. UIC 10036]
MSNYLQQLTYCCHQIRRKDIGDRVYQVGWVEERNPTFLHRERRAGTPTPHQMRC